MLDETAAPIDPTPAPQMVAPAPEVCSACGEPIEPGPVIGRMPDGKAYHLGRRTCHEGALKNAAHLFSAEDLAHPPPVEASVRPAVIVDMADPATAERIGHALGADAVRRLLVPGPMLRNLDEVLPEAVQGEGGPLALGGDPPQSTNTEMVVPPSALAAPAPKEPEVEVAKKLVLPISQVRRFFNPDCPSKCQEGMIATATGGGRLCWCAIKRCRDVAMKVREQARLQARAQQPAAPAQVNPRGIESLEKLTTRAARLDAQIAEADKAVADEIEHARAAVARDEENGAIVTRGIRQGEEAIAAFEEEKLELDRKKSAISETILAVEARLAEARAQEAIVVAKAQACRRGLAGLEERRDQRTSGMRNERRRLQTRIDKKLAHNPGLALPEVSPAPAPATPEVIANVTVPPPPDAPWPTECTHGKPILPDVPTGCADCAAADLCMAPAQDEVDLVVEPIGSRCTTCHLKIRETEPYARSSLPGWQAAYYVHVTCPIPVHAEAPVESSSAAAPAGPPEEKTPVVDLLDDGTPLGCAPGPTEEPAA